ncbi:MAG: hypothetical protein HRU15_00750 [Planctomycetes bacterium]|nr:hypothetical protein [Planctomycetota bacterium]
MARFENHFILLTEELADILDDEIIRLEKGDESIFLLRQAGHDIYGARRYRTREMQNCESLIHRMETILDKTGIFRDECILTVIDLFAELYRESDLTKREKSKADSSYLSQQLRDALKPFCK